MLGDMSQMYGRRGLTIAVVGVIVGAGLVLLGASRVWWQETVPRPAPLRPEEIAHTGASLAPVLPALGLVALAGAGGLLATRGIARRLVGGLLVAAGVGMVAAVLGQLGDPVRFGWPLACLTGAVVVGGAGVVTLRHGHRWPVMGSQYARSAAVPTPARLAPSAAGAGSRDVSVGAPSHAPVVAGGGSADAPVDGSVDASGAELRAPNGSGAGSKPSGTVPKPSGAADSLSASGVADSPSASGAADSPDVSSHAPTPSGAVSEPSDAASEPPGAASEPPGAASEPPGAASELPDAVIESSGAVPRSPKATDARDASGGKTFGGSNGEIARSTAELWDALDRGEDPTRG